VKNRFKKGMRPWNIDNKGVHMSPATEFHKGHLPANHRLKGSETIRIDRNGSKHRHIKVSGKAEGDHKWIPYARYVWEQEYGAIPKGKLIAHKNGDMFDDALDNLTLIERTELFDLMRRNNPKERQKAIRNLKKTCRIKRKDREVGRNFELELKRGKEKQRAVDLKHQQIAEAGIVQFRGPMKTWYECRGCGYEMTPPRPPCPKCGHLAFERIEQPVEYARRHAAANE
ncbi:MAG: HNH endonuclease, partial [Sedimentisphaerales bacterium]|nr:HNH endonuclease [Sedimentisphaerales bacterium]